MQEKIEMPQTQKSTVPEQPFDSAWIPVGSGYPQCGPTLHFQQPVLHSG
jgi:hypothetical protein